VRVEGGDIQHRSDDGPPATDGAPADALAAVARDRCQAGEGGDAPAVQLAEFRQFGDERCSNDGPDTWNGLEPTICLCQFGILCDTLCHLRLELGDATVEHGDEATDVGVRLGVSGLLEPRCLLFAQRDELAAPRRLRLKGATRYRQRQGSRGAFRRMPNSDSRRAIDADEDLLHDGSCSCSAGSAPTVPTVQA
jgi:hypothetical protein